MKKITQFALMALAFAFLATSCTKKNELIVDETHKSSKISGHSSEKFLSKTFSNLNDTIIPLKKEDYPNQQKKNMSVVRSGDVWSDLYQLEGIEFQLSTINSYFGKNTLKTNGAGQPLTFDSYTTNPSEAHLFYLKFLPASSGIPYMIYSYKEKKPVGIGSYQSDPNTYIVYTKQNDVGSTFGFAWDFLTGTNNKGYIVQNNDIPFAGDGSPWDIYYGVITNNQGNVSLQRNSNSLYQQFNVIPNDEFQILQMTMDIDNAIILSSTPTVISQKTVENPTNEIGSRTVTFTEIKQDKYDFKESSGVSYQYTANISASFELFKIIQASSSFTFTTGNTTSLEYTTGNSKTIQLSDSYTVPVPPQTRSLCTFNAMKHLANVPYTATIKGIRTRKPITIHGYFEAIDYTTSNLRVENFPITGKTIIPSNVMYIEPNKKK